ncbi:MAG: diadenylate cyclase [Deltaproteobacteria bacterium]|nr:diadenylate cyclase [Deltaproteobacteria bacterium]
MAKTRATHIEVIKSAVALASKRSFDHLLYVGDLLLPEEVFRGKATARKKLVQAVVSPAQRAVVEASGVRVIPLPQYDLGRTEKLKLALIGGIARGLYAEGEVVVALLSARTVGKPDSILVVDVGPDDEDVGFGFLRSEGVSAEILEALIDLAVTVGVEGWEGRPVGTLFVIGDSSRVMEQSRPLSLNPFQGYSEDERNMLSPEVKRALRAFAVLDGAFVLREDGVVLAAGRYLNFEEKEVRIPLGLGSRHMAAAGITHETEAIAVVVSQTTGTVRVFRHGRAVLELASRIRRS